MKKKKPQNINAFIENYFRFLFLEGMLERKTTEDLQTMGKSKQVLQNLMLLFRLPQELFKLFLKTGSSVLLSGLSCIHLIHLYECSSYRDSRICFENSLYSRKLILQWVAWSLHGKILAFWQKFYLITLHGLMENADEQLFQQIKF